MDINDEGTKLFEPCNYSIKDENNNFYIDLVYLTYNKEKNIVLKFNSSNNNLLTSFEIGCYGTLLDNISDFMFLVESYNKQASHTFDGTRLFLSDIIKVPNYIFDFINKFKLGAINDIIKGASGDDYYICVARVENGDLDEDSAELIQEWIQHQDESKLLLLVNGILSEDARLLTHGSIVSNTVGD